MRVVVDTNIVFSAVLNSTSLIGELLFNSEGEFEFYSSEFMEVELKKYLPKLKKTTSMNSNQLDEAIRLVFRKIHLISQEAISPKVWTEAYRLAQDIDEKDTPFVATALALNATLWDWGQKADKRIKAKRLQRRP